MKKKERVLVLGCGSRRTISVFTGGELQIKQLGTTFSDCFEDVVTIDMEARHQPTFVWDLTKFPWPVEDSSCDEVHAYEVLEHLTHVGDFQAFFAVWREIWRVLKPGGFLVATTPWWQSIWAWSDPGHMQVYSPALLYYLNQENYSEVGRTTMTDYRSWFPPPYSFSKMEFMITDSNLLRAGFIFVLRKEVFDANSQNSGGGNQLSGGGNDWASCKMVGLGDPGCNPDGGNVHGNGSGFERSLRGWEDRGLEGIDVQPWKAE